MKKVSIKIFLCLMAFFCLEAKAQMRFSFDSLAGFDMKDGEEHAKRLGKTGPDKTWFIDQAKRNYIDRKFKLDKPSLPVYGKGGPNTPLALNCPTDNYDFEQGSTAGWTLSGTCGLQSSGTDPYGGFPWVCPFGGSYSLMLSNDLSSGCCNSSATKSISVPASGTTFFTFYFALAIFNYPHTASDAGTFTVDFYDQSGNLIPCPQYLCYHSTDNGDVGVSNFQQTSGVASSYNPSCVGDSPGSYNVTYAPWQTVTADLTPYAGTTITAVFTIKWCIYNVDWLYALIDATCPLNYVPPTSTCVNIPSNICGPPGMQTYNWSTPTGGTGTGSCISATTAGIYTLNCAPALNCGSPSFTYTYNVQPIPTANFTSNLPACSSNLTVTDNSTLHGATVSSYSWDFGDSSTGSGSPATHTYPTTPGTYNVTETVTTTQGCTATVTNPVSVTNPLSVTVNSGTVCNGVGTTLTASGGATSYAWSPGTGLSGTSGASVTANPSSTTVYTVTGTNGTCSNTATSTVTVNATPTVTVASATVCNGNTGTITASGATTYTWNTGATGASLSQAPGTTTNYTVTGSSAAGCTNTATGSINVNPLPTVTVASATVCPGTPGTITASGASTYTWNTGATGATLTQSPASTTSYTATGTDVNGCINTGVGSITVGGSITPTVNSATICTGNSTTLTAAGAVTYTWSPGTGLSGTSGASVTANPTSTTTYTITGANGACTGTVTSVVTVNALPTITVNTSSICIGQQTATLTAGGASTYTWTPGTGLSSANGSPVTATPASTTAYTVTGTDANGCVNFNITSVTVNPLPVVTVNSATICPTFSATLTAGGASTYTWNTGATTGSITDAPAATTSYTVGGTDVNGCISGNTATITVNPTLLVAANNNSAICQGATLNLTASTGATWSWTGPGAFSSAVQNPTIANATPAMSGTYSVTATDANGCQGTAVTTVTVNPTPTITVNSSTICVGQQTATLTASGASTYTWTPGTGLSSANGSPVTATPASTTAYTVTGTDANGCVNFKTTSVTVNPLPVVTVNSATVCPTFSATLTAGGASTYTWNTGATTSSITDSPVTTTSYTVGGTDANGCISGNTATITVNPTLIVAANNNSAICNGATLNLTASTGVSWSWTGPGAYASALQNPSIPNATPAMSGTYSVTATDANGCQGSAVTTVTVNPLPTVTVNSATICVTQQTATLTASGSSISYVWSPSTGLSSSTGSSVNATPGVTTNYLITGTDVNGCVNTGTASVLVNPLPVVTVSGSTVCANATVNLTASGGVSYSWSGPNSFISNTQNPSITNATTAATGSYAVTVTDANGCVNGNVAMVTVNPLPIVTASSATLCTGNNASLSATGATTYAWSPTTGLVSANSATVTTNATSTTNYTVTGTDINGCVNTATTSVTVNPLPILAITPATSTGCAPVCVSFANTTTVTGTCAWSFGDGTASTSCNPTHCFNGQGTFGAVLTLTDNNGCVNTATATVVVYPMPHADFNATPQPTSIYDPHIYYTDASTGAVVNTWNWTLGDPNNTTATIPNPNLVYLEPGSYPVHLLVTTAFGCKDSITKIIVIADEYSLYVPNAFSPNGDGVNDFFFAKGEGIKDFKLYVFDRWGNQVFFSDDLYKSWDGRYQSRGTEIVQEDVYVWKIECKTVTGERKMLKGTVSLIK